MNPFRRRRQRSSPGAAQPAAALVPDGMVDMIGQLGAALLQSSRASSGVERILGEVVDAYGAASIRIFVLPTIVLVEDSSSGRGAQIFPLDGDGLRLDQAGQLESLIERVIAEQLPPRQVTHELHRIGDLPPRFGARVRILGHTILTLGFGLVLDPVAAAIPVYIVLGALVGLTVVFGARFDQLRLALPVLVPFAKTLLVALAVTPWIADDPVRLVSPALVSFLPGLALTLGAVELTSQQIVAGASRIVYAGAQLGLLVFGVFAALTISGVHPPTQSPDSLGSWAPWVGVALTAIGYTLFSVAPRGSLVWIALTLTVTYGAQLVGAHLVGAVLSGFVGAVVAILAVRLMRPIPASPPSAVLLTCAYWLLVPGAIGFIGLGDAVEGEAGSISIVVQTLLSIAAIALGMVVGTSVSREGDALVRRIRT